MKRKITKILDVAIHSINLILINYALSNMMALFRSSLLYILFFTSPLKCGSLSNTEKVLKN